MILGRLEEAHEYSRLHGGFEAAFDILRSTPFQELPPGRHEVMGNDLFLMIDHSEQKGHDGAILEAHRKYIDVQFIVPRAGAIAEEFGWKPVAACTEATMPYDEEKDVGLFGDKPDLWFCLPPGNFVVFFPSDAHAPLAGQGKILKAIVKIALKW
ncbi:MAG: YhcH/YjgK/YiaL family protein [Pirellulales bacterium]|nr:YhcH/YjgK/YiaL family protein [Pirellulales bacterium]